MTTNKETAEKIVGAWVEAHVDLSVGHEPWLDLESRIETSLTTTKAELAKAMIDAVRDVGAGFQVGPGEWRSLQATWDSLEKYDVWNRALCMCDDEAAKALEAVAREHGIDVD